MEIDDDIAEMGPNFDSNLDFWEIFHDDIDRKLLGQYKKQIGYQIVVMLSNFQETGRINDIRRALKTNRG